MRLDYTTSAKLRLNAIWRYLCDTATVETADTFEKQVLDKADELLAQPLKGHPVKRMQRLGLGHRALPIGRHLIVYRIDGERIWVTDVFDTKQHPSRMRG